MRKIFKKGEKGTDTAVFQKKFAESKAAEEASSWKAVSYHSSMAQRNFMLLISVVCLGVTGFSAFSVFQISHERTIEPFVVEIERRSGVAALVDPMTVKEYSANDALSQFFLIEYIRARELYIPSVMVYNYYTKVRLLSEQSIYNDFRYWIRTSNPQSPINLYANVSTGEMKVRSVQNIYPGTVQIRFGLEFVNSDGSKIQRDRIVTISFSYVNMNVNEKERQVNPLGFHITYYKADDEFL